MKEVLLPQEYLIRCNDGIVTSASVNSQRCLVNDDDGKVAYRLDAKLEDLPSEKVELLAKVLELKYEPPKTK